MSILISCNSDELWKSKGHNYFTLTRSQRTNVILKLQETIITVNEVQLFVVYVVGVMMFLFQILMTMKLINCWMMVRIFYCVINFVV